MDTKGKKKKNPKTLTNFQLRTAMRRQQILLLAMRGYSYRQIAQQLNIPSIGTISTDLQKELKRLSAENAGHTEQLRQLEIGRTDELLSVLADHWEYEEVVTDGKGKEIKTKRPDHNVIERVLKIMDRRAKLLGVDTPERHEHSVEIELLRAAATEKKKRDKILEDDPMLSAIVR
jgi:hypothetical protein